MEAGRRQPWVQLTLLLEAPGQALPTPPPMKGGLSWLPSQFLQTHPQFRLPPRYRRSLEPKKPTGGSVASPPRSPALHSQAAYR